MDLRVGPYNDLCQQCPEAVNKHIADSGFAQGHKRLVPLVQTRIRDGDQQRPDCPVQFPTGPRSTNALENSDTENAELDDMS